MNEQGVLFGGYLLKWIDEFSEIFYKKRTD